jgi:predicted nucleotidyltransferase
MEANRVEQNVSNVTHRCKRILEDYYGDRFQGLVLYGSTAREQDDPSSDIDLLVLLDQPFDFFRELRHVVDLLYEIQLESDRLISAKPAALETFDQGELQLYRNARREGRFVE